MGQIATVFSKNYTHQSVSILAVHLITIAYGVTLGWTAPIIPILQSAHTPLQSGPITVTEASWVGASLAIGGMTGSVVFALLHKKYGKKAGLIMLAIPHLILWSLLWAGDHIYYIYVARVLSGLTGGGVITIVPLFVTDIAERKIRGALGSLTILHINIGVLAAFASGSYLPYYLVPKIMLCLPIAFLVFVCLLPETPYCLLRKGRTDEAEHSLMFYRNITDATKKTIAFDCEFENMKSFTEAETHAEKLTLNDFKSRAAFRALFISVFVMALNQFSGILAILMYAGTILLAAGTPVESKYTLILLPLINICGNFTSFAIIDKAGRKVFLLTSTIGVGVSLGMLGLHSYYADSSYAEDYSWVPVLCMCTTMYTAALGITNVPFFIIPEILPAKLRNVGNTISFVLLCAFAFITTKAFPILLDTIHIYGTVWISSGVCAFGALVIIFLMPETKGKNLFVEDCKEGNKEKVNCPKE
ncbi:facilitated trehalose transporter Tret1-like isoform X2 [Toxorhynchites rutilus septentrionalis]|uniref:facilitated trehalose transporter Tret1-like isoform X2 n=1 Tax=Toxorhynchites rutilus septentrionalis TaxID=329112 RepID=UPI002478F775|nr:facilitated trehalose transporter Tret1-like isoform X2 [Toxorhynchites rutilus septentrionalis]